MRIYLLLKRVGVVLVLLTLFVPVLTRCSALDWRWSVLVATTRQICISMKSRGTLLSVRQSKRT